MNLFEHQRKARDFAVSIFAKAIDKHDYEGEPLNCGAALLMEMGCGKTVTAIAISQWLYEHRQVKRILIVAPLSILSVWEEELQRFAEFPYTVHLLKGTLPKKKQAIMEARFKSDLQIIIVNYESAWRLEKDILSFNPDLIIADEGHKLKEGRTSQSKSMHRLGDKAKFKLLLTGTVITNKEIDVFSQYRFLDKSIFGTSFVIFRNRYFEMTGYGNHTPVFKKSMMDEFLKRLHSVAFRVTKAECLDLPDMIEEVRTVDLEPKAMKLYKKVERQSYAELAESEVSAVNVLTKMLRLSQLTGGHITDDDGKVNAVSTAKLNALSDILDTAIDDNRKVVVMARFTAELDDIQRLLEKKQIEYSVIRGGITDRDEQIRKFQNDSTCLVFVGQIAAAGLGITLTAASTMIFYSLDYSMSNFEQAKARIHRVSQKNDCLYIYLIAKDTVDAKILKSLREKVDLARLLVDDYRNGKNPFQNRGEKC